MWLRTRTVDSHCGPPWVSHLRHFGGRSLATDAAQRPQEVFRRGGPHGALSSQHGALSTVSYILPVCLSACLLVCKSVCLSYMARCTNMLHGLYIAAWGCIGLYIRLHGRYYRRYSTMCCMFQKQVKILTFVTVSVARPSLRRAHALPRRVKK